MPPGDRSLDDIADAVLDGEPVDWPSAESSAHEAARPLLPHLRLVASVADAQRIALPAADPLHMPQALAAGHWGHLRLIEQIGRGTFGEVFRAWDTRLDREVALKLLPASSSPTNRDSAVIHEGRLLARVHHPNVVTIYGAEQIGDRVGLWMELVRGRTLEQELLSGDTLAHDDVVHVGIELCRAVSSVHAAGLLHRDIKAHNVMRARGGRIVLMDFGAARFTTPRRYRPGLSGSPLYLAPEVLLGSTPTAASDLYSLGVLLYYLVSGEFPVVADSLEGLRTAHSHRERRRLRDVRPDLPSAFVLAVDAATAPLPERRPESAGALEGLLEAALGRAPAPPRLRQAARRDASVAILPFNDLTPERALAYFCEGLAEEIFDALTRIPGVQAVAAWGSPATSFMSASAAADAPLDVATILEGSVRAVGARLRVNARLLDARTRGTIWSKQFTRELDDVFGVQDEIAQATAAELGARIVSAAEGSEATTPQGRDPEAYRLYLKGRHCWNSRTEGALHRSVSCFQDAIDRDPAYAEAHAGLAVAYTTLGLYGALAPHDVMPRAKAAAADAITHSPHVAAAHTAAGCIAAVYDWNWPEAARGFHRALESNVRYPLAHHWYAINYLVPLRRFDEAADALQRATDADPFSAPVRASVGLRSYFAHEFADAERILRETLEVESGAAAARLFLGLTLVERGDYATAVRELETAVHMAGSPEMEAALGYALARGGHVDAARALLARLLITAQSRYVSPSLIAQIHLGLGDRSQSLDWLERAVASRAADLAWINVRPILDPLRADARFHAIATRIHASY